MCGSGFLISTPFRGHPAYNIKMYFVLISYGGNTFYRWKVLAPFQRTIRVKRIVVICHASLLNYLLTLTLVNITDISGNGDHSSSGSSCCSSLDIL